MRDVPAGDEPSAPGVVAVARDAVEAWCEEDQQVFGHPRNPYHRVDCVPTRRRLAVSVGGVGLVATDRTTGVYEERARRDPRPAAPAVRRAEDP